MKKILKYFSIMIMVLLLSVGCGKKEDPQKILDEVTANMQSVESVSVKITFKIVMDVEGANFSMDMIMDMDTDKDQDIHGTASVNMFGIKEEVEMYAVTRDGYEYSYMKTPEIDEWQYTKAEITTNEEEQQLKDEMNKMFDSMSNVKEVKSDRDGYTKLEVTVDMKQFSELLKEYGVDETLPEINQDSDMVMNLYVKDGYVYILEIDYAEMFKAFKGEEDSEEFFNSLSEAKLTIEYSNFNKVDDIVVPEEIVNNAKVAVGEE